MSEEILIILTRTYDMALNSGEDNEIKAFWDVE